MPQMLSAQSCRELRKSIHVEIMRFDLYGLTTTINTAGIRSGRKRKSADDELDERPSKKQEILVFQEEPSSSSHPAHPVALFSPSHPPLLVFITYFRQQQEALSKCLRESI